MSTTRLTTVAVRLEPHELAQLDHLAAELARTAPGFRPTRSAAIRTLISSSSSVAGATVVAASEPPRGRSRAA